MIVLSNATGTLLLKTKTILPELKYVTAIVIIYCIECIYSKKSRDPNTDLNGTL